MTTLRHVDRVHLDPLADSYTPSYLTHSPSTDLTTCCATVDIYAKLIP